MLRSACRSWTLLLLFAPTTLAQTAPQLPPRTDRYGDPLPPGAVARLGTNCFRQGSWIKSLCFSPDGKTLAAGGIYGPARLWDVATGRVVFTLDHDRGARAALVTFSPDGRLLATAAWNRQDGPKIRVRDARTGKTLRTLGNDEDVPGELYHLAFSPDATTLAGNWKKGVCLWDVRTGQLLKTFTGQGEMTDIAFSPDGAWLATGGGYGGVRCTRWEVATGKPHPQPDAVHYRHVAFAPDGKSLLTADPKEWAIRLFDLRTGKEVRQFELADGVSRLAFSRDGKTAASVGLDTVSLWDVNTGKPLHPPLAQERCEAIAFSPDGSLLAAGNHQGVVLLWEVATGKVRFPREGHAVEVRTLAVAPDGKTVFAGSTDGAIGCWDVATTRKRQTLDSGLGSADRWFQLAVAPDGKALAWAATHLPLRVWDLELGRERWHAEAECLPDVSYVQFSPDGRTVAESSAQLRDAATGKRLAPLPTGCDLSFAPDGRLLAACAPEGVVVWDGLTGGESYRLTGNPAGDLDVYRARFSPNGRLLAGVDQRGDVQCWEAATGRWLFQLRTESPFPKEQTLIAFAPDGRLFATGAGEIIRLWDLATGKQVGMLRGHRGRVTCLAFFPDGRKLASGGWDTTVLLWDVSGAPARQPPRETMQHPALLESLWQDLLGPDAPRAWRAHQRWATLPRQALAFLSQRLQPVPPPDPVELQRTLAGLGSPRYSERQAAMRRLEQLGSIIAPALEKLVALNPSLEVRRRAELLLPKLIGPALPHGENLRTWRALAILEQVGTPEARTLLQTLATGTPGAWQTRQAQASLQRLERRSFAT